MSEIKVGDLVMVVKPRSCCGDARAIGKIHTVSGFHNPGGMRHLWASRI